MSRYYNLFQQLEAKQQGAFVPFITLGDPSPDLSIRIIDTLVDNGADALELGFPFSDPLADGPVIQAANIRSLKAGTHSQICFDLISQVRNKYPQLPIGLLVYANLVYAGDIAEFYAQAQQAGVDSILIADLPIEEADPFLTIANQYHIAPIFIAPPNASSATLKEIAQHGKGYTYLVSRAGVTGTETQAGMPINNIVNELTELGAPPALLGFGISTEKQVSEAIKAGAKGVICGSAIVKMIETHQNAPDKLVDELAKFTQKMKQATNI